MTDGEVGVKSNSRAGRRFYLQSRSYLTISHVGAPQLCMSRTRTLKPQMRSKCRAITDVSLTVSHCENGRLAPSYPECPGWGREFSFNHLGHPTPGCNQWPGRKIPSHLSPLVAGRRIWRMSTLFFCVSMLFENDPMSFYPDQWLNDQWTALHSNRKIIHLLYILYWKVTHWE